ncbi:MAG: hypothetical protein EAY75_10680, partial [Bacteroidetes bacterium]
MIVVARATATGAVAPTSGTTYTPSTSGSFAGTTTTGTGNIVIFNGTAAGTNTATGNLNITNLSGGTQYTLTAYEYNTASTCYNIASAASASFYTLCDAPTTNAATLVGSSSMTLNWTAVPGAASYRLDVSTVNDFSNAVNGFGNLTVAGTSQSVTVFLSPSQTYYYRVRAVNAAGAASANSTTASQATIAAATQFFLVGVPGTGSSGSPLTPFTVEARNGSNVLDVSFTGNISIAQASGSGTIGGNGPTAATAGVASFTITFTGADTYTINATGSLTTSATSGNIVVGLANATTILWSSAGGSAWLTGSNWTGGAVPTSTQVAQFAADPTGIAGVGINFANATNAGGQVNGQRIQDVGAIEMMSARSAVSSVGNSSTSAGATGTLNLTGVTVNGVPNTILRNSSNLSFTIQNTQGSGTQTMALSLGNATANVVNVNGSGSIIVSSPITGTNRNLTINCTSSGDFRVSGANTYTGGTTVNGGTAGGRLRVDAVSALPTTGDIAVNTGGRITLNIAGTYGGVAQSLTFNPNQTTRPSLDILSDAAVIWQGTVALSASTRIEAVGAAGSLTLSGNVSGSGLLVKQGAGNLILSGTGNNLTGNTSIGNGTLTINAGSGMGTGALTMLQAGTNNTALALNENQTVSSLLSIFGATSGTQTHVITIATGKTLTVNQTGNATYGSGAVPTLTSTIAGTGGLTKGGVGTLTLTSANTYTGATTVSGG